MDRQQQDEKAVNPQIVGREIANRQDPIDPLAVIEQRNKAFERLITYALGATKPEHWFDQQGKPYLGAAGSEVVARRCAVRVAGVRREKTASSDDKGAFYIYVYEGTFSLPGGMDSVEALGTCSSRDSFLGTATKSGRELSEIDEGNVMKAAYSNMIVNGVTRLLGLRGLSWDTLSKFGITQDGASKVTYNAGAKGGSAERALTFRFGRGKDKTPAEVGDEDLIWYAKAFRKDLADPEKAKYKANTEKQLAAVEAEQARRANGANGAQKPADAPVSLMVRLRALAADYEVPEAEIGNLIKAATGKSKPSELTEEDFAKCEAKFSKAVGNDEEIDRKSVV
jgi:hypothetical protein